MQLHCQFDARYQKNLTNACITVFAGLNQVSASLNRFKPHVRQKQVFAGRNPTLLSLASRGKNESCSIAIAICDGICRYILMDWLAEVASIKFFNSLTLHVAITVIDRFLKRQRVTRARLQLLGVAAMVLCSRY